MSQVSVLGKYVEELRSSGTHVHLELGHPSDPVLVRSVLRDLLPRVTSVGMNEEEVLQYHRYLTTRSGDPLVTVPEEILDLGPELTVVHSQDYTYVATSREEYRSESIVRACAAANTIVIKYMTGTSVHEALHLWEQGFRNHTTVQELGRLLEEHGYTYHGTHWRRGKYRVHLYTCSQITAPLSVGRGDVFALVFTTVLARDLVEEKT